MGVRAYYEVHCDDCGEWRANGWLIAREAKDACLREGWTRVRGETRLDWLCPACSQKRAKHAREEESHGP